MNTPDKCPHCGSDFLAKGGGWVQFECETEVYPDEPALITSTCTERSAHAATKAELDSVRAELSSLQSRWDSAGTAVTAEITRIQGQRDKAINTIDLMRDEFQRIVIKCAGFDGLESAFTREIRSICDRARSEIEQRTDVIVQRDEWQRKAERLEVELDDAVRSVVAIRCTKHAKVPKLNSCAHGDAECGACIAEDAAHNATKAELEKVRAELAIVRRRLNRLANLNIGRFIKANDEVRLEVVIEEDEFNPGAGNLGDSLKEASRE